MELTTEQIDWIEKDIRSKGITSPELQEDLLDHVCCIVEKNLDKGLMFPEAYDEAIGKFGPAGFRKLQKETSFLLALNSGIYKIIVGLDFIMTFILFVFSCSFLLAPLMILYLKPETFNILVSLPFPVVGLIVLWSGFDYRNFNTKKANSSIRPLTAFTRI